MIRLFLLVLIFSVSLRAEPMETPKRSFQDIQWVKHSNIDNNGNVSFANPRVMGSDCEIYFSPDNTLIRMCYGDDCVIEDAALANWEKMRRQLVTKALEKNILGLKECDSSLNIEPIQRHQACKLLKINLKLQEIKSFFREHHNYTPNDYSITNYIYSCQKIHPSDPKHQECREEIKKLVKFRQLDAKRRILQEKLEAEKK